MSAGDVGAERNVRAGANSDPRGEMRENVYCDFNFILIFFTKRTVPTENNLNEKSNKNKFF